ncbi:MAG: nucleoside deaminase [Candidatus Hydrogenedentes bacterium]|nr:nucleoside deaminase [Candidatus Hydrogenedentota bacterium]
MKFPEVVWRLPEWIAQTVSARGPVYDSVEDRMRIVIELARKNVELDGGGPFAAAVFERDTGRLVSPGVNMVVPMSCSVAHAEIVAIVIAQTILSTYDLGAKGMLAYELVSSTEPCAMCLGSVPWSGIRRLVCGARDEDARAIGFDEGTKPADWVRSLESRRIDVVRDILRDDVRGLLEWYRDRGGTIYNSRGGNSKR